MTGGSDDAPATETRPNAVIVAGPNGAGKSTLAPRVLAQEFDVALYVNADVIAQGLAGFDPASVAVRAGRIMLERIAELHRQRASFAVESTISGTSLNGFLQRLRRCGRLGRDTKAGEATFGEVMMKPETKDIAALMREGSAVDRAVENAFYDAVRLYRAQRIPLVMAEDGKPVHVSPFDIHLPEDDDPAMPKRVTNGAG